jgi:ATP-dependent exoDNAse (exonuclease V) beta subunit
MQGLEKDTELRFPSFTVFDASAGSGKTYLLTLRLAQLLLSDRVPHNRLRNILAVTFTNNAAKEMKERTLSRLKAAARGDEQELGALAAILAGPPVEVRRRARERVAEILAGYSDFQVRTIDSFLVSAFRAAAVELGYSPSSEIRLARGWTVDEAFERMARELRAGSPAEERLARMVDLIEADRGGKEPYAWDPYEDLRRRVKQIRGLLSLRPGAPAVPAGDDPRPDLSRRMRGEAAELLGVLHTAGAEPSVRAARILDAAASGDANEAARLVLPEPVYRAPRTNAARAALAPHATAIAACTGRFAETCAAFLRATVFHHYDPYRAVLDALEPWLERVRRGGGTLSIDDVAEVLATRMDPGLIPEVYLVLGERLWHHLIDEFQDTSPVQWQSMRPLLENALAGDGSLFVVGDAKQSIYTFRGADWSIMTGEMTRSSFASAPADVRPLTVNRRSKGIILDFVAEVFERQVPETVQPDVLALSGLDRGRQQALPGNEDRGYVRVEFLHDDGESDDPEREGVVATVRDCLSRGHAPADIALLTPSNDMVVTVSGWLNRAGIPVLSHSSLDIRRRRITGELMALLRFLDAPIDDLAFATVLSGSVMAYRGAQASPGGFDAESFLLDAAAEEGAPLYRIFRTRFPLLWKSLFEDLLALVGTMPLYDLVCRAVGVFDLYLSHPEEEAAITKLLEAVSRSEREGNAGIRDFLRAAEEEEEGWELGVPPRSSAVSVMTIHKAKGLGFPVVLLLLRDTRMAIPSMLLDRSGAEPRLLHARSEFEDRVEEVRAAREERRRMDMADELNRLYVALTRAEDELYVTCVHRGERGVPTRFIPPHPPERGRRRQVETTPEPAQPGAGVVHLVQPSGPPPSTGRRFAYAEMRRGDFIHAMLAQVPPGGWPEGRPPDEIAARCAGELGFPAPPEDAAERIRSFLAIPEASAIFAPQKGRAVMVEQELTDAEGRLFRADRIMVDDATVTVVDFKTGSNDHAEEYRKQVRGYMEIASTIFRGKKPLGLIAWVDLQVVEEVR